MKFIQTSSITVLIEKRKSIYIIPVIRSINGREREISALTKSETQTPSFRIWTKVAESIFYDQGWFLEECDQTGNLYIAMCLWCSRYRRRKWTQRHEFKSWMRLIAFSHSTNTLGKGMNPIILPPAMGK